MNSPNPPPEEISNREEALILGIVTVVLVVLSFFVTGIL